MDTNILTCMEAKGLITESQRARMAQLAVALPTTMAELLPILTAASIMGANGESFFGTPISVETLSSTDTAEVKTLTVPDGATKAIVSVHGNNIIFRTDGVNPTLNNGHTGVVGSNFTIGSLADFKFISTSTTDAYIFVSYF